MPSAVEKQNDEEYSSIPVASLSGERDDDDDDDAIMDSNAIAPESDLSDPNRRIWVVTTAGLPWMTGTAVNPMLRALYLTRGRPRHYVTLVIPWVTNAESRAKLYGKHASKINTPAQQEKWIRCYVRERANCAAEEPSLRIQFYAAAYNSAFGSIFPSDDICSLIPDEEADVAILEEPEHLNWFRAPAPWTRKNHGPRASRSRSPPPRPPPTPPPPNRSETSESISSSTSTASETRRKTNQKLGWAHKFSYVVGIMHTNYGAYLKQNDPLPVVGGPSIVAAPALDVLSALVVRAYCHRVIKLSDVVPSFAPGKEVTCNVHGVRHEFLSSKQTETSSVPNARPSTVVQDDKGKQRADIYFVGKLVWAKGFDMLLDAQELFHNVTGHYFPIDIYGDGPERSAIEKAFLGRKGRATETSEVDDLSLQYTQSEQDSEALALFQSESSLRDMLRSDSCEASIRNIQYQSFDPLSVISDLPGIIIETGIATSKAAYNVADSTIKAGFEMMFDSSNTEEQGGKRSLLPSFEIPQSRYEWRQHPAPARFMGVKDHATLIGVHKVFLNMSVSEVLCTTTAEALAMGKFVIIPRHPSNDFFFQFEPNCLTFNTLEECVEKIQWALEHDPEPLPQDLLFKFTWEAATERLFNAAAMTKKEVLSWSEEGKSETDERIAWMHTEAVQKGKWVRDLFTGGALSS